MINQNSIRILSVDDHPLFREGIAALINNQPDMLFVGEATSGGEALQRFCELRPDVTLMDLRLPEMSGIEALIAIRTNFPEARIIILTTCEGDVDIRRSLEAGARAYVLKRMPAKELVEVIRQVHAGKKRIPGEVATHLAEHHTDNALTEREIEVLRLVAAGNTNKLVANHLTIAEETVKGHMKSILSKLGANDRTHAVTLALRRGIIDL